MSLNSGVEGLETAIMFGNIAGLYPKSNQGNNNSLGNNNSFQKSYSSEKKSIAENLGKKIVFKSPSAVNTP